MSNATIVHPRSATGIPSGRLAIYWFFAGEITIFGGLLACYILYRLHHPEWAEEAAHTLLMAGAINTVVLITSSLTVVLAQAAAVARDLGRAARLLGVTILLGAVFLGIKAFEYWHEIGAGMTPLKSLFWSFYYLATGLHAAHLAAGMIALAVITLAVRKGKYPGRVEIVSMYWHFVDIVWAFLFPLFYLISRGSL